MISKKGNTTIILLGVLSVMILMTFALSRRMSSHTQLLTMSDYTQISRYFLESYAGDIMQNLKKQVNDENSKISKEFRAAQNLTEINIDDFYKFNNASELKNLANDLEMENVSAKMTLLYVENLKYPFEFSPKSDFFNEKKGVLQLICNAQFKEKKYTLKICYKFTNVFRLTPILKDFILYSDKIGREQGIDKIGFQDKINLMFTAQGYHSMPKNSTAAKTYEEKLNQTLPLMGNNYAQLTEKLRPMILLQPLIGGNKYNSKEYSGKIYLGPSNEAVYINLAGEPSDKTLSEAGQAGEIYKMLKPSDLGLQGEEFKVIPLLEDKNGNKISVPAQSVDMMHQGHKVIFGIMGFSFETINFLEGTIRNHSAFLNTGSNANDFWKQIENSKGYMAFSSGLKLLGLKSEEQSTLNREIFGNVFARFFVFSFWQPGTSANGQPLEYNLNKNIADIEKAETGMGRKLEFKAENNKTYKEFMSKMVSGNHFSVNSKVDGNLFMPLDKNQLKKTLKESDFCANDGARFGSLKFDNFSKAWFYRNGKLGEIVKRIGHVFENQNEFKEFVGLNNKNPSFKIGGIVHIKGKKGLEIDKLDMPNNLIDGGIILVDGPIKIGNITRGQSIDNSKFSLTAEIPQIKYTEWLESDDENLKITKDKFITFVSLKGEPITITGETLLGVHLINLYDSYNQKYDQIKWQTKDKNKEIIFLGGIACNYLNLSERLKEFGKIKSSCDVLNAPFFMYHPEMASDEPSIAVQISQAMHTYSLTSEVAEEKNDNTPPQ